MSRRGDAPLTRRAALASPVKWIAHCPQMVTHEGAALAQNHSWCIGSQLRFCAKGGVRAGGDALSLLVSSSSRVAQPRLL
jgi:hypothetical protein